VCTSATDPRALLKLSRLDVAVCCSVLQCIVVCCSVLQCVAVCCSVLQCVAVRCSAVQCGAVRCSALQRVAVCSTFFIQGAGILVCCSVPSVLQCAQCVAVCCNVLQHVQHSSFRVLGSYMTKTVVRLHH